MTHLFIYLLIYLSLFTVQPRFNEVQGNGKRAVLYGLVKLSFDLAYSRCCFGGSDIILAFLNLFVPIPCTTVLLVQLKVSRLCRFQYCFLHFSFSKSH